MNRNVKNVCSKVHSFVYLMFETIDGPSTDSPPTAPHSTWQAHPSCGTYRTGEDLALLSIISKLHDECWRVNSPPRTNDAAGFCL